MELKKFKFVSARQGALWRGEDLPAGVAKLVIAGESEEDVKWFFSKLDWTAWKLEQITEPTEKNKGSK